MSLLSDNPPPLPCEMQRVTSRKLWEHLDRWSLVASESRKMPIVNTNGHYVQTGYFSVAEVVGTKLVPDESNLLAVIRQDGKGYPGYFINLNARPEPLSPL